MGRLLDEKAARRWDTRCDIASAFPRFPAPPGAVPSPSTRRGSKNRKAIEALQLRSRGSLMPLACNTCPGHHDPRRRTRGTALGISALHLEAPASGTGTGAPVLFLDFPRNRTGTGKTWNGPPRTGYTASSPATAAQGRRHDERRRRPDSSGLGDAFLWWPTRIPCLAPSSSILPAAGTCQIRPGTGAAATQEKEPPASPSGGWAAQRLARPAWKPD